MSSSSILLADCHPSRIPSRCFLLLCALLAVFSAGCGGLQEKKLPQLPPPPVSQTPHSLRGPTRTVVIDPGHGGDDPGAAYHGLKEKDINLDIAGRLKPYLDAVPIRVQLTRDNDTFIELSERAGVAHRMQADAFVSIHANANRRAWVSGIEVYYPRESEVTAVQGWPPRIGSGEAAYSSTTIRQLAWDLVLRNARSQSELLAEDICTSLRAQLGAQCITKPARFVVLRQAQMPAVLVETGYLSNPDEAKKLGDADYRQRLAEAVGDGLLAFLSRTE